MKIAIIVSKLNVRGGTHKQVLRLCQYLDKENINFVLCTKYYDPENTYPEFSNYNILHLHKEMCTRKPARYNIIKKAENFFTDNREDLELYNMIPKDVEIVNAHDVFLERIIQLAKKNKKKVVWQINDLDPSFGIGAWKMRKDSFFKLCKRCNIKRIAKKVDQITVNVTKNKERVKKYLNRDATVLYCGVDRNDSLSKHTFRSGAEFRLLSMGVFFPYRNYETLVKVIKEMRLNGKNISLDIIGSTTLDKVYAEKITAVIKDCSMEKYIRIHGQVDEKTYTELFNQADAFAFINLDQSWGLAVFEAMSCGLPTIVSNSVGAIELLHNDKDSVIVDPVNVNEICEVLERLMTDSEYYNIISNNAFYAAKEYTWDSMYSSKLVEIFKKL